MAMWILAKSMSWPINFIWILSKQEFGQNRLVNVPFWHLQIDAIVQQSLLNVLLIRSNAVDWIQKIFIREL